MSNIQSNVEWLIPTIQALSLESIKFLWNIAEKESELANLSEVIRLNAEILELKKSLRNAQEKETWYREEGKQIMLSNDMKEITMLDWTTISLHFSPWALVVEEWAKIPNNFYKVKTSRDLDKTAIKKAITEWTFKLSKVYIQKDCKFIIKTK